MKFWINDEEWDIVELNNEKMSKLDDVEGEILNGLTEYTTHTIYINKDIRDIKKTLIHELTHCFMYTFGHNQFDENKKYSNEDVCEICACSYQIIDDIIKLYFEEE